VSQKRTSNQAEIGSRRALAILDAARKNPDAMDVITIFLDVHEAGIRGVDVASALASEVSHRAPRLLDAVLAGLDESKFVGAA
jgi:hypothetical protein